MLHYDENSFINYKRLHRIDDEHLVYKESDLDTTGWAGDCGNGYDTHSHTHSNTHSYTKLNPDHPEDHAHKRHGRGYHPDKNDNHVVATTPSRSANPKTWREKATRGERNDGRRSLTTSTTRWVELLIVNDPGRVDKWKDTYGTDDDEWYDELVQSTIDIVSVVSTRYLSMDWGDDVGTIQLVLSQIVMWLDWDDLGAYEPTRYVNSEASNGGDACPHSDYDLFKSSSLGDNDYCEVDFDSYLSNFQQWRVDEAPDHDNAQLFSYYDFYSSVIGYASLPGMCITYNSGGINQATYSDTYNANIVSHEMGHNFDMQHDGTGNDCDDSHIMASSASPYGYTPTTFSDCSVSYVQSFFDSYSILSCLSNEPYETEFAVCGNGFVEQGESCDCGASNCDGIDSCCDGSTCAIYNNYDCSNSDACCADCQIIKASENYVCRELDTNNDCDIEAEYCDGTSSTCPSDTLGIEGTSCTYLHSNDGLCYNGQCISISEQCDVYEAFYEEGDTTYDICDDDVSNGYATDTTCDYLYCKEDGSGCDEQSDVEFEDGTPCTEGTQQCTDAPCQCEGGACKDSDQILTYIWTAGPYSACSIDCREDEDDEPGVQIRLVNCTLQDGTIEDDSNCDADSKPQSSRQCNDFECTFCEGFSGVNGPCNNGTCSESSGSCICDNGYGGEFCDVKPGLYFQAITRRVFNDGTITISHRADPCNTIPAQNDGVAMTVPVNESSLDTLYVGETVYLRWNSTGDLDYLAVGLIPLDPDSKQLWPEYVGETLATDNQACDSENGTSYDPCFNDTSCDDFGFEITSDITPGFYQIIVRFNEDFEVLSKNITIECNPDFCNKSGHGYCNDTFSECVCTDDYYGGSCSSYNCSEWEFRTTNADAWSESTFYDKCHWGDECIANATDVDDLCDCGIHWGGTYCEHPIDGCSTFVDKTECDTEEASTGWCVWDSGSGSCVYDECYDYDESECANLNISTTCYWDEDGYCARITCDDIEPCENGAVRRSLHSALSICDSWYCDCSTVSDSDAYWTVSLTSTLSRSNTSSNLDIFVCDACSLDCAHGSDESSDCTTCDNCDDDVYGGVDCNKVQWIGEFKVLVEWDTAAGSDAAEFDELLVQDLAYYFGISTSRIEIWQLKGDGDGNSIVYFKYIFDTTDDRTAQATGGDVFTSFRTNLQTEGSVAYRGFLLGESDSSYELTWCLPENEECDPDAQFAFWRWFYICLGGSYGFEFLVIIIYRLATSRRRQKAYEEKVREVRKAQLRLMEHHQKARRVGMRDVSKNRAHKIHRAKDKQHKEEVREARRRSKVEADEIKRRRSSQASQGNKSSTGHGHARSEVEFQNQRLGSGSASGAANITVGNNSQFEVPSVSSANRAQSHSHHSNEGGGRGGNNGNFNPGDFERPLPPGWTMYMSNDGIPYYYNSMTGETSWRHPMDPKF